MAFAVTTFLKYGFLSAVFLLSTELFYFWYEHHRKRIASRSINECAFTMSDNLRCCDLRDDIKTIEKCQNQYCKAKLSRKIIQHINSAKHLICIAMYMLTTKRMADVLSNAKKRGVTVRIISNHSMIYSSGSQINRLQAEGLAVRIAGDNKDRQMHNKFCLIDVLTNETTFEENSHPLKGILITGSLNWTMNAFDKNFENILFTSDEHLKSEYKQAFDHIWSLHA